MSQLRKVILLQTDLLFEDYCINSVHKKLTYFPDSYST